MSEYDPFVRDRLPPADELPEFRFDLPALQYPERLNGAVELLKHGKPGDLAVVNAHGIHRLVLDDRAVYERPEIRQRALVQFR